MTRVLAIVVTQKRDKQRCSALTVFDSNNSMASSRDRVEDTYESQNDQRLDELHSKIRTLRGVSELGGGNQQC